MSSAFPTPPTGDASASRATEIAADLIIVEDDAALLYDLLEEFRLAGYRPVGFQNPVDGLLWAADAEPTCILVDLKLPGIEGLDLVAAFCALNRHAVILVSAYIDVRTTVEAMRLGVVDVVEKPFSVGGLLSSLEKAREALSRMSPQDQVTFTRRERQVAELIVEGRTTKQIAQVLELSPRTVEFFRASLLRKTHSPNTAALVAALSRIGFSD